MSMQKPVEDQRGSYIVTAMRVGERSGWYKVAACAQASLPRKNQKVALDKTIVSVLSTIKPLPTRQVDV
jgi:hypothetical protein